MGDGPRLECDDADGEARRKLIVDHIHVALGIARKLARRYHSMLAPADFTGAAMVGLCEAAGRFDRSRVEPFVAFAELRIRGAVLDEVRRAAGSKACAPEVVGDSPMPGASPRAHVEFLEVLLLIARARDGLPERQANVITMHYDHGMSLTDVARRLRLTLARVTKLHAIGVAKLRGVLAPQQAIQT
jgi:RNA polymerase sigma factor (sigma-70 family)